MTESFDVERFVRAQDGGSRDELTLGIVSETWEQSGEAGTHECRQRICKL